MRFEDRRYCSESMSDLNFADDAIYFKDHTVLRHRNTRINVMETIKEWIKLISTSNESKRSLWLNGVTGVGRSMIPRLVVDLAKSSGLVVANFFFSPGMSRRHIFPVLAYQLALFDDKFKDELKKIVTGLHFRRMPVDHRNLSDQFDLLIKQPWHQRKIHEKDAPTVLLILDSIDKIEPDPVHSNNNEKGLSDILIDSAPSEFFIFFTGRMEPYMQTAHNFTEKVKVVHLPNDDRSTMMGQSVC